MLKLDKKLEKEMDKCWPHAL